MILALNVAINWTLIGIVGIFSYVLGVLSMIVFAHGMATLNRAVEKARLKLEPEELPPAPQHIRRKNLRVINGDKR